MTEQSKLIIDIPLSNGNGSMANHLNSLTVVLIGMHATLFSYMPNSINITIDIVLVDGSDVLFQVIRKQGL